MFADVVNPSITVGSRTWYSLPLSIVAHAVIGAVLVIVPLMTADVVRLPPSVITFLAAASAPLPPPSPSEPQDRPIAWMEPRAAELAPVNAPSAVAPQREAESRRGRAVVVPDASIGAIGGLIGSLEPELLPPAPAPDREVVRVGGHIRPPAKIKDVKPGYPSIAQAARVQGVVIIEATIGPDGRVEGTRVLRSIPLLDAAAIEAVRQWEYTPTLLNGLPVSILMTVTVNFTLTP